MRSVFSCFFGFRMDSGSFFDQGKQTFLKGSFSGSCVLRYLCQKIYEVIIRLQTVCLCCFCYAVKIAEQVAPLMLYITCCAPIKQGFGMICFLHVPIRFTGINTNKMFRHYHLGRHKLILFCNHVRKLFPAIRTEFRIQFFFCHIIRNCMGGQSGQIRFLFPCSAFCLPAFLFPGLLVLRLQDCLPLR